MIVRRASGWIGAAVLVVFVLLTASPSEPFFNNDETRHLMTGVFVRDLLVSGGWSHPIDFTLRYYLQYPALGLLIWPPLFYVVEGLAMIVAGNSLVVGKTLILGFGAVACWYVFALARRSYGVGCAVLASVLFAVSPLIIALSRQVMLEIPALAFVLGALYHALAYVDERRSVQLWTSAALAAAAVLTRFDAVVILPTLALLLWYRSSLPLLWHRTVLWAAIGFAALTMPVVLSTAYFVGSVHSDTIVSGAGSSAVPTLAMLTYYLRELPSQVGWWLLAMAAVGLAACAATAERRQRAAAFLALAIATYATFSVIAEQTPRHTIFWVPAIAVFGAVGLIEIRRRTGPVPFTVVVALVLAGTASPTVASKAPYIRGYEAAARYVVSRGGESPQFLLFDGNFDGNFIYQVRRLDPTRAYWVLRADKALYSSVINPGQGYQEFVSSDQEVLDVLFGYDIRYVVIESAPFRTELPAAQRLRRLLSTRSDRFVLERTVPLESDMGGWARTTLLVYRSLVRNPAPKQDLRLRMLTLGGRDLSTSVERNGAGAR